jgi:prepilin-type N-terminal cleavage/methylation domain-containing protein
VTRLRSGFTLFELMLVMAIVLVAGALSIPAIEAMMADARVKGARDMVRAKWADIRARAIDEGRPYKFSIIGGSGLYKLEPVDINEPSDTGGDPLIFVGELPPGVLFASDQGVVGSGGGGGDYETWVTFLPDGTAREDKELYFGKEGIRPIGLRVRALTGAVMSFDQPSGNGQ